jgi:hypothetical protein
MTGVLREQAGFGVKAHAQVRRFDLHGLIVVEHERQQ